MVDLSNSLSIYTQSDGRRPDLKVLSDLPKPYDGYSTDESGVANDAEKPHLLSTADNKLQASEQKTTMSFDTTPKTTDSDTTDDLDDLLEGMGRNQVNTRPAFNCKRRLTTHSK